MLRKQAYGNHYFNTASFALAVREVPSSSEPQHPYDLTDTEHYHDFSELVIITAGQGIQVVNGTEYQISAGDVFLLQGFSAHYFKTRRTLSHVNVMFNPDKLPLPEDFLRRIPGYNVIFRLEPTLRSRTSYKQRLHLDAKHLAQLESLVGKLKDELEFRVAGYEVAAFTTLLEIIVFISRSYDSKSRGNAAALLRVGKVISRLENDFAEDWTLAKLAKLAAMSPNNLLLLFKAATGSSPIDYLIKIRLRNAAKSLRDKRESIAGIAFGCGFRDSNYFSKKFRNVYGMTPRQYRDGF